MGYILKSEYLSINNLHYLLLNTYRFMESEFELHDILTEMHAIATVPDLYPVLVHLKAVLSLLELLSHENTDIAVSVVNLLQVRYILIYTYA